MSIRPILVACSLLSFLQVASAQNDPPSPEPPSPFPIQQDAPAAPASGDVELDPAVRDALDAAWLTEQERADLRVVHGVWTDADLNTPLRQAIAALTIYDLDHPALDDERTPVVLRAEGMFKRGELREAVAALDGVAGAQAVRIRAEALELLGEHGKADAAVDDAVTRLLRQRFDDAAELTEGVAALRVRSRVRGQPARDFQNMMTLLSRAHQQLDRLYWPARLAEAQLLMDKDNMREAADALQETLRLNPRAAEAWYLLGRSQVQRFNFDGAEQIAEKLRELLPESPLALLLTAEARLVQDDPAGALALLDNLLRRYPKMREAWAFAAAAHAITYDRAALDEALARYDELSPGGARAHYVVGKQLSFNRQYQQSAEMLEEAIRRQPKWPAPQIELGLMELQSGRDDRALAALRNVAELDPFNKRAANSLFLLEELAEYKTVETDHFIIRYQPGIDRVLVDLMPERLERIHEIVSERFQFEPDRKTTIEVAPDHKRFAVRITGMPFIHTVAACTGPVIAMEVPREGPPQKHLGLFDWPRVLQHEYTHTITLAQTQNRIPHWLTEAAAVSMEYGPRIWRNCLTLAQSFDTGTLFDLDEIKWAFVRPKKRGDRGKAYAQGHWMVEYMNEEFGEDALIRLLERYHEGDREAQAMPSALGVSRQEFYEGFLAWAEEQVAAWGLSYEPSIEDLKDAVRENDPELSMMLAASKHARLDVIAEKIADRIGKPADPTEPRDRQELTADDWPPLVKPEVEVTEDRLMTWLGDHPEHPDLWELRIRRKMQENENAVPLDWYETYSALRPVDPFPHKKLAQRWLASDSPMLAIDHLEYLDAREEKTPVFALQLARLYREKGDTWQALEKSERAVAFNPYHAANRELAAAIAVQSGRLDLAERHIDALTLIEPERPVHAKRLERIRAMREQSE